MTTKIGALIIDLPDVTLTAEDREIIAHPLVGGIVLFSRNYSDPRQLKELCHAVRAVRSTPLLIMVDQEGGRVQRFKEGFTRLPAMGELGVLHHHDPQAAAILTREIGWLMAQELLTNGVDVSLAPVLDLNKQQNSVIGDRAFHAQTHVVTTLAQAWTTGMAEAGMAAVGKHFPGHGNVTLDSHVALPIDERPLATVWQDDMEPFKKMIQSGLQAIMAAHILFPQIDKHPVGFSTYWLREVLRKQLQFTGVILSDDLHMEGANISANYADRVQEALAAGCDFALLCNARAGVIQALDQVPSRLCMVDAEKWGILQGKPNVNNARAEAARALLKSKIQSIYFN